MKQYIKKLNALHLFCLNRFKEAFDIFLELETGNFYAVKFLTILFTCRKVSITYHIEFFLFFIDILFVIGLFHELIPKDFRERLEYPHDIPILESGQLKEAMKQLIHFLRMVSFFLP